MAAGTPFYLAIFIFVLNIANTKQDVNPPQSGLYPNLWKNSSAHHCHAMTEFRCISDGKCIPLTKHCDKIRDCADASDEDYCGHVCHGEDIFECHNHNCVHQTFICDGENDCEDWSDEKHCELEYSTRKAKENYKEKICDPDQFFCDIMCVPNEWRCDGSLDCLSGIDEMNCNSTKQTVCEGEGTFSCGNHCIRAEWVCDGTQDCSDGSDEKDCALLDTFGKCSAEHGFFGCQDGKCLSPDKVCNGIKDCTGGEDEGALCSQNCTSHCSHGCMKTPSGARCTCRKGFTLKHNNSTCQDIDECHLDSSVCSQKCRNSIGSYSCFCYYGFLLHQDKHSCFTEGIQETIYFTLSSEIRSLTLTSNNKSPHLYNEHQPWELQEVTSGLTDPRSLDVDIQEREIIVIDETEVYKLMKNGRHKKKIISTGLSVPEQVAIDWVARNFYLTDSGTRKIIACTIYHVVCTVVLDELPLEKPRGIAVDPIERVIFWTDFSQGHTNSAFIGRSNGDGSDAKKIITTNLGTPNVLAIDHHERRIVWSDLVKKNIESSDYHGHFRKVIVKEVFYPTGLDIFGDWLYWVDSKLQEIQRCMKANGKHHQVIFRHNDRHMTSLSVAHHLKQHMKTDVCLDADCSDLCLPTPKKPYFTCACPTGFLLGPDGRKCKKSEDHELVMVSVPGRFILIDPHILGEGIIKTFNLQKYTDMVTAMAYDPVTSSIIFAESDSEMIFQFHLRHQKIQPLYNVRSVAIESISIDDSTGNIYLADAEHEQILLLDSMGRYRKVVISNLTMPIGLSVVSKYGLLFVAVGGGVSNPPMILKCSLDGTNCTRFVTSLPAPAVSMFYDEKGEEIYWTYGSFALGKSSGTIQSVNIHTGQVDDIRKNLNNPESIVASHKFLYWVSSRSPILEWTENTGIRSISKLNYGEEEESKNSMDTIRRLALIHSRSPSLNNVSKSCGASGCSHFCIPVLDGRHVCECPVGMTLSKDLRLCVKIDCEPGMFQCGDGDCIHRYERCDGLRDCADNSDELNCESDCVDPSLYLCHNNECIRKKDVCDGEYDCMDHSDEKDCYREKKNCTDDEYACKNGWQCINFKLMCDGQDDCFGDSEEVTCSKDCPLDKEHCAGDTSICISHNAICDGFEDCPNGSDEKHCEDLVATTRSYKTFIHPDCPQETTLCHDKLSCVHDANICDGEEDCDDGSDELDCENNPHHKHGDLSCPQGTFSCYRGFLECIPMAALCNCSAECSQGEDELHCPPTSCENNSEGDHYFSCPGRDSTYHIPPQWVCDGEYDCSDGYDEGHGFCNSTYEHHHGCPRSFFECRNGNCIPNSSVCDKTPDCADGSDEGWGCDRPCSVEHCSHACLKTPSGPQCLCPPGFKLSKNKRKCDDVNECALTAIRSTISSSIVKHHDEEHHDIHEHHDDTLIADECAQTCENVKGGYKCRCQKGYRIAVDGHSCKADIRPYLLFATLHNIRSLRADWKIPEFVPVAAHSDDGIVDMNFDIQEEKLLWLSSFGIIYSVNSSAISNPHASYFPVRYNLGLKKTISFTYDWASKDAFVVERRYNGDKELSYLKVCRLDRSICDTIYTTHSLITDIACDPTVKRLFWSETQLIRSAYRKGTIGTLSMDGKQSWFLKDQKKVLYPVSLSLDPIRRRVFWADLQKNTIEFTGYNGEGHGIIVRHLEDSPVSISFFENRIYWISQGSNILSHVSLHTKDIVRQPLPFHNIRHLTIYHYLIQPEAYSACHLKPCSDICVDSDNKRGYICGCPEDSMLDVSGHTCLSIHTVKLLQNTTGVADFSRVELNQRAGVTVASIVICIVLIAVASVVIAAYTKKNRRLRRNQPHVSWLRFRPPVNNFSEDSLTLEDSLSIDYAEEIRRRNTQEQSTPYGFKKPSLAAMVFKPVKSLAKKTASSAANLAARAKSSLNGSISSKSPLLNQNQSTEPLSHSTGVFIDIPVNDYNEVSTDLPSPRSISPEYVDRNILVKSEF
ncbi:vitellogenin receptor Yl-like [Artemia franciscana]|uniref:vitellogenin receptor Yl-like n=1 Tax=Artemia franciscana TaxID=6661 RepID=UPI0032D9D094